MELLITTIITTITTLAIDFFKKYPLGVLIGAFGMIGLTALIGFNSVSLEALKQAKGVIESKTTQPTAEPVPQEG